MTFDGQRFRTVRNPETGSLRCEVTDEYRAYLERMIARREDVETELWSWVAGGMVGRLVLKDGVLSVDTSDPAANGELVIHEEQEGVA